MDPEHQLVVAKVHLPTVLQFLMNPMHAKEKHTENIAGREDAITTFSAFLDIRR